MSKLSTAIVLAVCAALTLGTAAETAAALNCSTLPAHVSYDLYTPSEACAADPAFATCLTTYADCEKSTCSAAFSCLETKARCMEQAMPGENCTETSWYAALTGEKMYLSGGGDYNGSMLELSCQHAVCDVLARPELEDCAPADYSHVCIDISGQLTTAVPMETPDATMTPTPGEPDATPIPGEDVPEDGAHLIAGAGAAALALLALLA